MQDVEAKLADLEQIFGPKIAVLKQRYYFELNPSTRRLLEAHICVLHDRYFSPNSLCLPPPPPDVISGSFELGSVLFDNQAQGSFGLRDDELPQHLLITGRSGSGKSNCMKLLAQQFSDKGLPFWLFSFKREYRGLSERDDPPIFYTPGRDVVPLFINPLSVPPGSDRETWINLFSEAIASTYYLGEGSISIIRQGLSYVYETYEKPLLIHLQEWLQSFHPRGRASEWLVSTRRAIDALCFGRIGEVLNSENPTDLGQLLDKQVVFEMDCFNADDRSFLIQVMFRWLYRYAIEKIKDKSLKMALLIDEAHYLFSRKSMDLSGKESYSDQILRLIREFGISIILADQVPSMLSVPAMANTYASVSLNLKTNQDVTTMGSMMLMTADQKQILGRLPVGTAVVKLQDRYTRPFLIKIPKVSLSEEPVDDYNLAEIMLPRLSALSLLPVGAPSPSERIPDSVKETRKETESEGLDLSFLLSILDDPFVGTSARYKKLGLSTRHGNEVKDRLLRSGLVEPTTIHIYKNTMLLFEITEDGKAFLCQHGHTFPYVHRSGGIEHRFGLHTTTEFYKSQGFEILPEYPTKDGKFLDVVVRKDDVVICNQIETGKSTILENIHASLNDGITLVNIIATNPLAYRKSQKIVKENNFSSNVRVYYLTPSQ